MGRSAVWPSGGSRGRGGSAPRLFAGGYHDALIREDGTIFAWGTWLSSNIVPISSYSDPTLNPNLDPNGSGGPNTEQYIAVSCGHFHLLAITSDGKLRAWGSNVFGQTQIPGPPLIQPTDTFIAVSAGYYYSLAMKSDGTVVGWEMEGHPGNFGASEPPPGNFGGLAQGESAFHALGLVKQGGINCYANCDGSTATPFLNVNDYICFTNLVAAGDLRANCDLSQTLPVINVNDLVCFQNLFVIGCD